MKEIIEINGNVISVKEFDKYKAYEVFNKGKTYILNISDKVIDDTVGIPIGSEIILKYESPILYKLKTIVSDKFDNYFINNLMKQKKKLLNNQNKLFKNLNKELVTSSSYPVYNIGFNLEDAA